MFPDRAAIGSGSSAILRQVPGNVKFSDINIGDFRAVSVVNNEIMIVSNGNLLKVDSLGVKTNLVKVPNSPDTYMSRNNQYTPFCIGGKYYVWDGSTLTTPTGGPVESVGHVNYFNQYTILTSKLDGKFEWTDLADPTSRDGLNFATAESVDDALIASASIGGILWLFGERSIEPWVATRLAGENAFTPMEGAQIPGRGLLSANLLTSLAGTGFFVGDDFVLYTVGNSGVSPISNPTVNTAIQEETPSKLSIYEYRSHKFVVVHFDNRPAWCYDLATGEWHERSSGVMGGAWRIKDFRKAYGKWMGITGSGNIFEVGAFDSDDGEILRRVIQTRNIQINHDWFSVNRLVVEADTEVDLMDEDLISLSVSRDRGRSWEPEIIGTLGVRGEYLPVRWDALGAAESGMAFRFVVDANNQVAMHSDMFVEVS